MSATPRQLESLIRLSEALARMELQATVQARHVQEALRLMRVSMQQSALDARTGMIDMDKLYTGVGALDRQTRRHLGDAIRELLVRAPLAVCLEDEAGMCRCDDSITVRGAAGCICHCVDVRWISMWFEHSILAVQRLTSCAPRNGTCFAQQTMCQGAYGRHYPCCFSNKQPFEHV